LRDANLIVANLIGANLRGADLPIITIIGSVHSLQFSNNKIRIGCEYFTAEHWLENYESIGKENNYTVEQLKEYKKYIDMCKEFTNE